MILSSKTYMGIEILEGNEAFSNQQCGCEIETPRCGFCNLGGLRHKTLILAYDGDEDKTYLIIAELKPKHLSKYPSTGDSSRLLWASRVAG